MIIHAHPDNVQKLVRELNSGVDPPNPFGLQCKYPVYPGGVEIIPNPNLEKERPTGRVIHPGRGCLVDKEAFVWTPNRFITYDVDSLPWLIGLGIVKQEMKMYFYVVNEPQFKMHMDMGPVIQQPRAVIKNYA